MAMLQGPNRSISGTWVRSGLLRGWDQCHDVMRAFHKVFHVSMLRKCLHKDDEVLAKIPEDHQPNMTLEARPVRVLERRFKELR